MMTRAERAQEAREYAKSLNTADLLAVLSTYSEGTVNRIALNAEARRRKLIK